MEALAALRPYTYMLGRGDEEGEADIFQNPVTRQPWHDERSQREHYWTPTLKRLKIRRRRAYCTRHTFCTVALMAGVNPAYIAAQAGHSTRMLLEKYTRWIPGADGGSERARLAAAMAGQQTARSSQTVPNAVAEEANSLIQKVKSGRRDWTRTNDPHHVKDVDLPWLTTT